MMAAGMQPMATMPHKRHVARFSSAVLRGLTGLSLWKYSVSTARMAPIWMTTRNSARNSGDTCSCTKSSTMIMWPVDEMGSHSVTPSTMPMSRDFNASIIIFRLSRTCCATLERAAPGIVMAHAPNAFERVTISPWYAQVTRDVGFWAETRPGARTFYVRLMFGGGAIHPNRPQPS